MFSKHIVHYSLLELIYCKTLKDSKKKKKKKSYNVIENNSVFLYFGEN